MRNLTIGSLVPASRPARLLLFLLWLGLALFLAAHHVVWRDEVRALSFALAGNSTWEMLHIVHGEGHPAIWYLMLRAAHAIWAAPQVMLVVAFVIGAAAALLFAMRAPFAWPWLALALFGRFCLYEYTVVARNYGIAMLAMFGFAALYRRYRDTGWVPGLILLLLCNTNVPSVMLAGALLLYWGIELLGEGPIGWTAQWRAWGIGAGLSLLGVILCFIEVYPPFNDAAPNHYWHNSLGATLARLLPAMGKYYWTLMPREIDFTSVVVLPILMYGSLLAFCRSRAALIAAAAGMLAVLIILCVVYRGDYRHQALILPFFLTLAWIEREKGNLAPADRWVRIGTICFALLLVLQIAQSVAFVTRAVRGMPASRSRQLAQLLRRPELSQAIVIGDPDFKEEVVPYYTANQTCFVREKRCGPWSIFSKKATHLVTVDEITDYATALHDSTGRPVVILVSEMDMREEKTGTVDRGNYGPLLITKPALDRFHRSTAFLARYDHVSDGDESYDVYLYDGKQHAAPALPPLA